jgi:shikimate dehydrogenase
MTDPIWLGVFGWPAAHSKSPQMHQAAARALGIDLRYERFEVAPEQLADAVRRKHAEGIDGYNLTVPHKEAIVELLDDLASSARAIGAVNTVVRAGDGYVGHNTDAPGLVRALEEAHVDLNEARAVVLGAGGAARAAAVGLSEAGASRVTVLSRRAEQGKALVSSLRSHLECELVAAPLGRAAQHFPTATVVVQATSATLKSNPEAREFAQSLPMESLPAGAVVLDMVYEPLKTTVLERAEARGLRVVNGLGMLLHQGAIAFEMWTGFEPPLDVMRAALC